MDFRRVEREEVFAEGRGDVVKKRDGEKRLKRRGVVEASGKVVGGRQNAPDVVAGGQQREGGGGSKRGPGEGRKAATCSPLSQRVTEERSGVCTGVHFTQRRL